MTTEVAATFKCGVCLRVASVDEGGADDHPEACSSCWSALTACVTEATRIQHITLKADTVPDRSAPITAEYECGWRDAAAIIVGRLNGIGHHAPSRREALIEAGQACVDWAEDTGDCHLCGYDQGSGKPHDEQCPLRRLG